MYCSMRYGISFQAVDVHLELFILTILLVYDTTKLLKRCVVRLLGVHRLVAVHLLEGGESVDLFLHRGPLRLPQGFNLVVVGLRKHPFGVWLGLQLGLGVALGLGLDHQVS